MHLSVLFITFPQFGFGSPVFEESTPVSGAPVRPYNTFFPAAAPVLPTTYAVLALILYAISPCMPHLCFDPGRLPYTSRVRKWSHCCLRLCIAAELL